MSKLARMPEPEPKIGPDEAVKMAIERCMSGQTASNAITEADLEVLTDIALREFALAGWRCRVSTALSNLRTLRGMERGRNARTFTPALDIQLVGAHGTPKRLRDFTGEDLESLMGDARARRIGWAKREGWAKDTLGLLGEHHAERVGALPRSVLEDVEESARKAWRGSR